MVRDQVNGSLAEQVSRARQLRQCVAAEIAEIDEAELAVAKHDPKRTKILCPILRVIFERRASVVRLTAAGQGRRQEDATGADDVDLNAFQRQAIPRLRLQVSTLSA